MPSTEFGHGAFLQLVLKDKSKFFFHNTARFPWHALVLHAIAKVLQCQGCSRSILSGMCPVCTEVRRYPSPRLFLDLFILKGLGVIPLGSAHSKGVGDGSWRHCLR